jgi:uncharacterized protein YegL
MKENLTEIVAILDRSGSMQELTNDTIGGFNNFIEEQKKVPGEANVTTVLFDDEYKILHNGINLQEVRPITLKEYFARGSTALLDAMGKTINDTGAKLNAMNEQDRPSKVIVLIITDGEENASREYSRASIKEMVERQRTVYNWQFLFFGANIDSFKVGNALGIPINHIADYSPTDGGVKSVYAAMSLVSTSYRNTGKVDESYKKDVS